LKVEAKERQGYESVVEKIPQLVKGKSRDRLSKLFGVNAHYVQDAFANWKELANRAQLLKIDW
jgi:hypothetical protein